MAYRPGAASMIQCFESSDWGSIRRVQHEWSHNYGAMHDKDGGTNCDSPCINNGGWDRTEEQVADVWCNRCKKLMEPNLGK